MKTRSIKRLQERSIKVFTIVTTSKIASSTIDFSKRGNFKFETATTCIFMILTLVTLPMAQALGERIETNIFLIDKQNGQTIRLDRISKKPKVFYLLTKRTDRGPEVKPVLFEQALNWQKRLLQSPSQKKSWASCSDPVIGRVALSEKTIHDFKYCPEQNRNQTQLMRQISALSSPNQHQSTKSKSAKEPQMRVDKLENVVHEIENY